MKISITNPCPENWDNMQDSEEGKFCEVCSRCVIDFSEKTDQEIKEIIDQTNSKRVCGKIVSKSFFEDVEKNKSLIVGLEILSPTQLKFEGEIGGESYHFPRAGQTATYYSGSTFPLEMVFTKQ